MALKLMKWLTIVAVVFIGTVAIPELNGRFLHNHFSDRGSGCRWSLGLTPATQWYKVRLCRIKTHEFAVFCGGCIRYQTRDILLDCRLLYNRLTDSDALCGRLLAMAQASQWYKVVPPGTCIHEVNVLNSVLPIPELDG